MFERGLVAEVKSLLAAGYTAADPGMRGIGYRQLLDMRSGCETLMAARDRVARDTRRYAKRQLTFFRSLPGVSWIDVDRGGDFMARVEDFLSAGASRPGTGSAPME
jgi:tRNA dimethylallyltransferase